jgi:hypothetical protein
MQVAYFPNQCALNSVPIMQAMLDSLQSAGHNIKQNSMSADAVIIWSVLWSGRMASNQVVWSHYKAMGKPIIVVDIGALYRSKTWKIALNSITANGYYGHTENLDWDRPKKLGISLALNFSRNPQIVIAAQHKKSLQVAGLVSVEDWIVTQVDNIKAVTDRPIVIRPHPRSPLDHTQFQNVTIEQPKKIISTYDSYNLVFDCHAIVNYNSGPGIQAALAGTRPVVDSSSLAHPVAIQIADIEKPYNQDRDQWLVEICHTEYTIKEIKDGLWIHRLKL